MGEENPYLVRSVPITDLRAETEGDGLTFSGYAAVFDAPTAIDSWEGRFTETILKGAFRKSLRERTPVLQFDHGGHPMIGSIPIGTITDIREDDRGVRVEARLHAGDFFAPVREAIASGSINGMSFRFQVIRDRWDYDVDPPGRELVELRCPEVGPVVFPAYAETEASVRARAQRYAADIARAAGSPAPHVPPAPALAGHPGEADSTTTAPAPAGHPVPPSSSTREEATQVDPEQNPNQKKPDEFEGMSLDDIRNKMSEVSDELTRLDAKATPTEDDVKRSDDLTTAFDRLAVEERRQVIAQRRRSTAEVLERARYSDTMEPVRVSARDGRDFDRDPLRDGRDVNTRKGDDPWQRAVSVPTFGRSGVQIAQDFRTLALDAVARMSGANDKMRQTATTLIERFDTPDAKLSRTALAISDPAYLRAFAKMMQHPTAGTSTFDPEEMAAYQRAMSLTDNAGGFMVPFQLDPTVIVTSAGSYNQIRQVARQVVATGDVWNGVSAGATSWSFDAESAEVSDDTSTFAQPAITLRTARGFIPYSIEVGMDAANLTGELGRLLAEGREDLEATVFITGTAAANQPVGIISTLTGTAGSIQASATTDTLALADISAVVAGLPAKHRARASWLANYRTYLAVKALDTSDSVWEQPALGVPPTLYGRPTYEAEAIDGVINATQDNFIAVLGNFDNYVIADRIGMNLEFIPHMFATANNLPSGQRGWFAWYRTGADSVNDAAFRLLNVT
jgi:HK97 family phage major capsid protein/HK97 family phage prohead protease